MKEQVSRWEFVEGIKDDESADEAIPLAAADLWTSKSFRKAYRAFQRRIFVRKRLLLSCGLVGVSALVGLLSNGTDTASPVTNARGEAGLRVLRDPQLMQKLGLCAALLTTEAHRERNRATTPRGTSDGITEGHYKEAATLAARYQVTCVPSQPAATVDVMLSGNVITVHTFDLIIPDPGLEGVCQQTGFCR